MSFHPLVHAIVSAGGLAHDGARFQRAGRAFLFPVRAMGQVLRAKLISDLWHNYRQNAFIGFADFEDPEGFGRLINQLPKRWNVYAKPSFENGNYVRQYLGRYTHRVALANSRLLDVTSTAVTFRTKGGKTATLHPVEFLRRFVHHVLPDGFHKIRHIGLNASKTKREQARRLLEQTPPAPRSASWQQQLLSVTGRDVSTCPHCNALLASLPLPRSRSPPGTLHLAA